MSFVTYWVHINWLSDLLKAIIICRTLLNNKCTFMKVLGIFLKMRNRQKKNLLKDLLITSYVDED